MSKFNIGKFLNFLVEGLFLLIIFCVPLYFCFYLETNEIFEFHKFFIFRSLFFVLLLFSSLKLIFVSDFNRFKNIFFILFKNYFWPVFVFLIFSLLSIMWSIDRYAAFYGSLDRQFGWLNYLLLLLFFVFLVVDIIISNNYKNRMFRIFFTITLSGFFVSIYAIFQFFGLDFFQWTEPARLTGRSFSSLGQPNSLGLFLILILPISFYLLKSKKSFLSKGFYLLVFASELIALFFSGSRSAWLGFVVGLIFYLAVLYFKNNKRIFYTSFFVFLLLFSLLFSVSNDFKQRVLSSFNFDSGSTASRSLLWPKAFEAFLKRPLGHGLENQREALIVHYEKDWGKFNVVNVVFDRSHNVFLDVLLTLGVFGFVFFIFLVFQLTKLLLKNINKSDNKELNVALSSSFLAYFVFLQFNFSSLTSVVLFLVLLSISIVLNVKIFFPDLFVADKNDDYNKKQKFILLKYLFFILVLFISIFGIKKQADFLTNDYYFFQAKRYLSQGKFGEGILMFSYIDKKGYMYDDYAYYLVDTIFGNYTRGYFYEKSMDYLAKKELENVLNRIEKRKILSNSNSFFLNFAESKIFSVLGEEKKSEDKFLELILKSSNFPDLYLNYARHKIIFNKLEESLNLFYKVSSLLPGGEIESDVSRNRLIYYKSLIDYEINSVHFKINNNGVK